MFASFFVSRVDSKMDFPTESSMAYHKESAFQHQLPVSRITGTDPLLGHPIPGF